MQQTTAYLKSRFENTDKPTAQDFIDLIDTFATKVQVGSGGSEILESIRDNYIPITDKGIANGVATLDSDGNVSENANNATNAISALTAQTAITANTATDADNATNYKDGTSNLSIKDALAGKQTSLEYIPEDVNNKSNTISGHSSTLYPTLTAVINYIANTVGGAIVLQGDWNANTNIPDISGTTIIGHAWRVSVAGTTDLDGIVIWEVGDLAVYTANGFTKIGNELIQVSWGALTGDINNQQDLIDKFDEYVLKTDISTDNTLGGETPLDTVIPSEKAIKEYVDTAIEDVEPVLTSELIPNTYTGIPLNVPIPLGTPIETIVRNLLRTYVAPSFQSFSVALVDNSNNAIPTYCEVGTRVTVGNAPFVIVNDSDGNPATSVKVSGTGFLSATVRTSSPAIPDAGTLTYTPTTISNQDWTISGKDKNDNTVSLLFRRYNRHRMYFGSSATELSSGSLASDVQNVVNLLLDGILISSRTSNQTGTANTATLTCTDENNDVLKYTYIAYISSLGDITSIIKDGALPVLGAFTRLGVWSIMSRTGTNLVSIPLSVVVYKSNSKGAFQLNTTLNIR
jgi:hypothetical protein